MKAINAPPRMSPTNKMAQRNPSITESEVLLACFFVSSEVSSFALHHIFSPFCPAAVLTEILKTLFPTFTLPLHSCSLFVSSITSFATCFTLKRILVYIGNFTYFISLSMLSCRNVTFTCVSSGSIIT